MSSHETEIRLKPIAAIYARKSTEQAGVNDEEKSINRQIEHAKAYAEKKGWQVAENIYSDDGISGAEFVKRPGFLRLMNALKPQPPFQVLIMSEESRLGREAIETGYVLKQILDAGVRVFFYLEDRERVLDSALDKVMLSLTNFASEVEREKARQRTHDAMLRKAKAGHVTGGVVFGYDNVEVLSPVPGPDGRRKRQYVKREINPMEAKIVRKIFELCASGLGISRIAKKLNSEAVPPPRKGKKGWAPSAIREILHRPLYRGEIVWNKTRKVDRGGTKKLQKRPPDEWIMIPAPELGIIPDDLWKAAHARLENARRVFARGVKSGQLMGRPSRLDLDSKYLLSGFGTCAVCGGPIISLTRDHGKKRVRFYGCSYNHKRGTKICSNSLIIRQEDLDISVLDTLMEVLDEGILELAVGKALKRLQDNRDSSRSRRTELKKELSAIGTQEQRLVEAIKRGEAIDSLVSALKLEDERKKAILKELENLSRLDQVSSLETHRMKKNLKMRVADTKGLLKRNVPQARQMLRKLLVGRLELSPTKTKQKGKYRFSGQGTYGGLLAGTAGSTSGGDPSGI